MAEIVRIESVRVPEMCATDVRVTVRLHEEEIRSENHAYTLVQRIGAMAHRAAWQLTGVDRSFPGRLLEHVRR